MKKLPERDEVQIAFWRVTEQITFLEGWGCIKVHFRETNNNTHLFEVF